MQLTLLICLLPIPALFGAPDDECARCDLRDPLRCGSDCLQIDDHDFDTVEIKPSRQGEKKPTLLSSKYRLVRNSGDLLCVNIPSKGKFNPFSRDIEGFIVNKGKYVSLNDLLEIAHSKKEFNDGYKNPFDSHHESNIDMKKIYDDIGGIVVARGNWGKLGPSWG